MTEKIEIILHARPIWILVVVAALALGIGLLIPVAAPIRGPVVDINDTLMIAIMVALAGFVAQLYLRMGKLETDLQKFREDNDGLRADLSDAASFINRVGIWVARGCKGPIPQPSERLAKHVDTELWPDEQAAIGGTD